MSQFPLYVTCVKSPRLLLQEKCPQHEARTTLNGTRPYVEVSMQRLRRRTAEGESRGPTKQGPRTSEGTA